MDNQLSENNFNLGVRSLDELEQKLAQPPTACEYLEVEFFIVYIFIQSKIEIERDVEKQKIRTWLAQMRSLKKAKLHNNLPHNELNASPEQILSYLNGRTFLFDELFEALKNLPSLKTLEIICFKKVGDFEKLCNLTNIECLKLDIKIEETQLTNCFRSNKNLRVLHLEDDFYPKNLANSLLLCTNLEELRLRMKTFDNATNLYDQLSNLPNLRRLLIIGFEAERAKLCVPNMTNLEELYINDESSGNPTTVFLDIIKTFPKLQRFQIAAQYLDSDFIVKAQGILEKNPPRQSPLMLEIPNIDHFQTHSNGIAMNSALLTISNLQLVDPFNQ